MTKWIQRNFSLRPEESQTLDNLANETGLKPVEVLRLLIEKATKDPKCREIMVTEHYRKKAQERLNGASDEELRIMSNVKSQKKDAANHMTASAVSLNCQPKNNRLTGYMQDVVKEDPYSNLTPEEQSALIDKMLKELYPETN